MLQRLLPHFKIKKITQIGLEDIPSLCDSISRYIPRAETEETPLHHVLGRMQNSLKFGAVWFLYEGKDIVGFLVATITKDAYGRKFCLVNDLFVMSHRKYTGWARKLADIGIAWVRQTGVKKIIFLTVRNPEAMCRLLPGNWQIDSTVLKLVVS